MCATAVLRYCQGGNTTGEAARILIEDVHDSIYDLVELIQIFNSKNKLSKLFLSTLFKRRQEELDAVVDRAIMRLQVSRLLILDHLALSVLRRSAQVLCPMFELKASLVLRHLDCFDP